MTFGGVISPFNAWLLIRGLRTLPLRLEKCTTTTQQVVEFLEQHPATEHLYYPFLPSHPQHQLALKYLKYGTGQFTFTLKTDDSREITRFCENLTTFKLACSWGGYESLLFPAITLKTSLNYSGSELPVNMIRCYIGLENHEYLVADLTQALEKIK